MTTELLFEHACADAGAITFVEWLAVHIQGAINGQADRSGMATPQTLLLVLADDFIGQVTTRSAGKEASFTLDRVGGVVSGKNLDHPTDASIGQVILNANAFDYADSQTGGQLLGAYVLAHELWHPPLTWTRHAATGRTLITGQTPDQAARAMARVLGDEYRADILASIVLNALAGPEPQHREPGAWRDAWLAGAHVESLREALTTTVHPGWADTIEAYRDHRIDLMTMWNTILRQTHELLTLLAHAEAASTNADHPPVLAGDLAGLPGNQLYVNDLWEPIASILRRQTLLPGVDDYAVLENELATVTETAVMTMWESLGLTFDDIDHDTGDYYIHVTDPVR